MPLLFAKSCSAQLSTVIPGLLLAAGLDAEPHVRSMLLVSSRCIVSALKPHIRKDGLLASSV
jgi:hypothetical protein